jgi:lipopolysaccharide biosynthesis glycosyltransferase
MTRHMRLPPASRSAVCFCVDRRMLIPALFVAKGILSNRGPSPDPFDIIIFAGSSEVDDIHRRWMEQQGIELCDDLDMTRLRGVAKLPDRLSEATLVKLVIAQHLAGRYDKLLYLDADLTIHDDISPLFRLDTGEFAFAAVPSGRPWTYHRTADWKVAEAHYRALGMTSPYRFFNTGVLYIDVEKWNQADIAERTLSFIRQNAELCFLPDEHGLNGVIDGRLTELSPIWNARPLVAQRGVRWALFEPVIVHHAGHDKPWHRFGYGKRLFPDLEAYRMYEAFLAETPWPGWLQEHRTRHDIWLSFVWEMRRMSRKLRGRSDEMTRAQHRVCLAALKRFCDTETFADVEQGITVRNRGILRLNDKARIAV